MVFFNYSTMQMAAKVVYYGPGLCGKTTNLHYIYAHTAGGSRGEMVSLETETDRTLFFDLLPIDVGTIAGFNTRIQLYTVPGQVFYNTTRKLVLKGVDGVVFVADSQRPMVQANVESFRNLEENLAEMGLSSETLPLVLQFNKRDLPDICSVEEMNQALNRGNWPWVEASAVTGTGVFETLKEVSKVTLLALKKRLARGSDAPATPPRPAPARPAAEAPAPTAPPLPSTPQLRPQGQGPAQQSPQTAAPAVASRPASPAAEHTAPSLPSTPQLRPQGAPQATPQEAPAHAPAAAPVRPAAAPPPPPPASARPKPKSSMDVLGELEKLRRQTMTPAAQAAAPAPAAAAPASTNGGGSEMSRNFEMNLKRADFQRARRLVVSFHVEDEQNQVVESVRDLPFEIKDAAHLEKLLLRLNIALHAKE